MNFDLRIARSAARISGGGGGGGRTWRNLTVWARKTNPEQSAHYLKCSWFLLESVPGSCSFSLSLFNFFVAWTFKTHHDRSYSIKREPRRRKLLPVCCTWPHFFFEEQTIRENASLMVVLMGAIQKNLMRRMKEKKPLINWRQTVKKLTSHNVKSKKKNETVLSSPQNNFLSASIKFSKARKKLALESRLKSDIKTTYYNFSTHKEGRVIVWEHSTS